MEINLNFNIRNGDSGEEADFEITVVTDNKKLESLVADVKKDPGEEGFNKLFVEMYDNQDMEPDSDQRGLVYDDIWNALSNFAFDKLGWNDVTAAVQNIQINGEDVGFNLDEMDTEESALQLSRDGFMYCYS